jgi:hypothetical protein
MATRAFATVVFSITVLQMRDQQSALPRARLICTSLTEAKHIPCDFDRGPQLLSPARAGRRCAPGAPAT